MAQNGFRRKLSASFISDVKKNTGSMRNLPLLILVCLAFFLITTSAAGQGSMIYVNFISVSI